MTRPPEKKGRRPSKETVRLIGENHAPELLQRHAAEAKKRTEHGRSARDLAEGIVPAFNAHHRERSWGVVTTLLGQYLTVADGSSRFEIEADTLPIEEAMSEYWPRFAPKPWAAQQCFIQAFRAGMAVEQGLWRDGFHDRFPSRTRFEEPSAAPDGRVRSPRRDIIIGLDDAGRPITVKQRSKWELIAATYVESRSEGAWLGYMATDPPDDWDHALMLGNDHWGPEWGHPACILPDRSGTAASLFQCSIYPMLGLAGILAAERVQDALDRVWRARRGKCRLLDEPSFTYEEAIKILGAMVGICPQAEATARQFFRFCHHRARSGLLSPLWSLRICRHESCVAPLFIHEPGPGKGDAAPRSYCDSCSTMQESDRRKRARRRAKLREEAEALAQESPADRYPSVKLPKLTPEEHARWQELLHERARSAEMEAEP